jgi:Flp pilus assembly protein TadG
MGAKDFRRESGHAAVEIALMSPWILLLFIAVFNFGFYAYTMIAVENAARVAALHTSGDPLTADDSAFACFYALQELRTMPNVGSGVSCTAGCAAGSTCTAGPISVRAQRVNAGVDGAPASQVSVTYQGIQLFPLPWLMGRLNITRVVDMKI